MVSSLRPRWLPIAIAILPLVAIGASYYVAAAHHLVPGCNPFLDGCTSISATGRYEPASYIFKPAHLLLAALLSAFWYQLGARGELGTRRSTGVRCAGLIAAAALAVYTLTLGSQTPAYEFMRRFGIYFFFAGTVLAQLLATLGLRAANTPASAATRRVLACMLATCLAPVLLGVVNFVQKAVLADPDPMENRIEWSTTVLMQAWFVFFYGYLRGQAVSRPVPSSADRL